MSATKFNNDGLTIDFGDDDFHGVGQGPFIPLTMCIDVSGSMETCKSDLIKGFEQFYRDILADEKTAKTVLLQIITFNGRAEIIRDYQLVERNSSTPSIITEGATNIVDAVEVALDSLDDKKQALKQEGATYYQPWLVLLTDGEQYPANPSGIDTVANRVLEQCRNNKLVCFPIGIGNDVNWTDLGKFSLSGTALRLKDNGSFREFFKFISGSASATSRTGANASPKFDKEAFWKAFA